MAAFICANAKHHQDVSNVTPPECQPDLLNGKIHSTPGLLLVQHQEQQQMSVTSLQFAQSSHKDPRLLKDPQELLKCPLCPLSAVCLLKQQGKEKLPRFKAMCSIWNKQIGGLHSAESTLWHCMKELQPPASLRRRMD